MLFYCKANNNDIFNYNIQLYYKTNNNNDILNYNI